MHATAPLLGLCALVGGTPLYAQVAYPDHVIQDVDWNSGTHHTAVTQLIVSPAVPSEPVEIAGSADAEFVSGTQVHLADGFHAGAFGSGQFHGFINEALGPPGDVVVISPDPTTSVQNGILHVNKWEKLEIGVKLPQDYRDAIQRFFSHYYSNGATAAATPNVLDRAHDLNPYADDSLQLVMTLNDPSGDARMKWGFFMKEGKWSGGQLTRLTANTGHPLNNYSVRYRFAPDQEGLWTFSLSIRAPYTNTLTEEPLPSVELSGYQFVCAPPLEDNHGFLNVNATNHRTLVFDDGTSFFGLGTNMADVHRQYLNLVPGYSNYNHTADRTLYRYLRHDHTQMLNTMEQLHSVGGNYVRMWMLNNLLAFEQVNPGVYDSYKIPRICTIPDSPDSCDDGYTTTMFGNGQYQAWALDSLIRHARRNNIYIQLNFDPNAPGSGGEKSSWGAHPYVINFLDQRRDTSGVIDMKEYFFEGGDSSNTDFGVFYYWKRRLKYMMARWGYSVNIAALEPFNEVDGMPAYREADLRNSLPWPVANCAQEGDDEFVEHRDMCPENRIHFMPDTLLPVTLSNWLTKLTDFVRQPVNPTDPAHSPLGEAHRLFLMSYTSTEGAMSNKPHYYEPFRNPKVDLVDVHLGLFYTDEELQGGFRWAQDFRNTTFDWGQNKPFHQGEFNYYAFRPWPTPTDYFDTGNIFGNSDISFHNEIWASTFFGNFAAGTTWQWQQALWWTGALPPPPPDFNNEIQTNFSSLLGDTNHLFVNDEDIPMVNHTRYHHFKPLTDLLNNPDWRTYDFFNGEFTPHKSVENAHHLECFYLMNAEEDLAIGWIHNTQSYWMKNYYITSTSQHYLDCTPPVVDWHWLYGFQPGVDYHVTWFPTRMDTTVLPTDYVDSLRTGAIFLDLSSAPFGGVVDDHLDSLRTDYAFIISREPIEKRLGTPDRPARKPDWDFAVYPNPAMDEVYVKLSDESAKDIAVLDLSGRCVRSWSNLAGTPLRLHVGQLAKGAYWIRVSDRQTSKAHKLIIH